MHDVLALLGAGGFGAILGWYLYYINRYRTDAVRLSDLVTLVGAIGGGAVLALFPARSALFGAYGIGLFCGFYGYFTVLVVLVKRSRRYDFDWFLEGGRREAGRAGPAGRAMEDQRPQDPINP